MGVCRTVCALRQVIWNLRQATSSLRQATRSLRRAIVDVRRIVCGLRQVTWSELVRLICGRGVPDPAWQITRWWRVGRRLGHGTGEDAYCNCGAKLFINSTN